MGRQLKQDDLKEGMLVMVTDVHIAREAKPSFLHSDHMDYFNAHAAVQYEWSLRSLIGKPLRIMAIELPFIAVRNVMRDHDPPSNGFFVAVMGESSSGPFPLNTSEVVLCAISQRFSRYGRPRRKKKKDA